VVDLYPSLQRWLHDPEDTEEAMSAAFPFPAWLNHEDGSYTTLWATERAGFHARMFPEQIAHLSRRFPHSPIQSIAVDTPSNIIWRRS
jgi:hypothetical protein